MGGGGGLMGQGGQGYEQNHQEVKGMNRTTVAVITDGTRRSKLLIEPLLRSLRVGRGGWVGNVTTRSRI